MNEMREEVGKKKRDGRHMDDFWHNFDTIWALSYTGIILKKR